MLILFILYIIQPLDSIQLKQQFRTIATYNNRVYLAPFIGTSIFYLDSLRNIYSITFTDDINYPIRNFKITPFSIYINNGKEIDKFDFETGINEKIYSTDIIISFIITRREELMIANKKNHCIDILDSEYRNAFQITGIKVQDLAWFQERLYVLARNSIMIFNQFGNPVDKIKLKYHAKRLRVDSTGLLIFSPQENYFYEFNQKWQRIELNHKISDIALTKNRLIILDDKGTTLYIYNK